MAGSAVDRRMLHPQEVADMLGLSPSALRQAARQDRVPSRRWGRKLVFLADEVEAFLAALPRGPVEPPPAPRSLLRRLIAAPEPEP